ncbi:unnamed protein product [Dicrocoelium dendriticum]|nr:unnamed protein product [Dicrocoelium dendriticum]
MSLPGLLGLESAGWVSGRRVLGADCCLAWAWDGQGGARVVARGGGTAWRGLSAAGLTLAGLLSFSLGLDSGLERTVLAVVTGGRGCWGGLF